MNPKGEDPNVYYTGACGEEAMGGAMTDGVSNLQCRSYVLYRPPLSHSSTTEELCLPQTVDLQM